MVGTLQITLFGSMKVVHEGRLDPVKLTPNLQGLLAFLLLNRDRSHPRDVLLSLFWGDLSLEKARGCLNTTLWRLRHALEPEGTPQGTYLLTNPTGDIGFNRDSPYWLDVALFEEQSRNSFSISSSTFQDQAVDKIEKILALYQGDLLEGFYDDWALRERERLRLVYLKYLENLMVYYKDHQDYGKSIAFGQKILEQDPLHEEIHREMMRLYLENGQRAHAVRQYQTCKAHLAAELNIPPMEETEQLYRKILSETSSGRPVTTPDLPKDLKQAVQQLHLAQKQVQEAVHYIQRFADEQRLNNAKPTSRKERKHPDKAD